MSGSGLAALALACMLEAALGQVQVQRTGPLELSVAWTAAGGGRLVPAVVLHKRSHLATPALSLQC
jgi:hypothetical protein